MIFNEIVGYNKHILRYTVRKTVCETEKLQTRFSYLFAEHGRCCDFVLYYIGCHKMNKHCDIYLAKSSKNKI